MSEKKEKSEKLIEAAETPEKGPTKVEQAAAMFDELKAQGLKPKEIYGKIAKALSISVRSARGYVWRAKNPEAYQQMLKKYFEKRRARLKKAEVEEAKKEKKAS